ncbi:MAG: histidine kinase with domain [Acidimicrobiales bacterium]|nr:histidine kinase with domain [Acidimicrobiales bacterium]
MLNPLQRVRSIKTKLSTVIVAAVAITLAVNEIGLKLNFRAGFRAGVAAGIALGMVQLLARGMTSPLRTMERAATAMADGDYSHPVVASSADEVGRLAHAFNHMASELAQVDRQRRDLVANVSHELRTPISALRATLENLVDGVVPPDPELLGTMLAQVERLQRLVTQLLDLSRLESGASPLHRERFEVADLLHRVADEARLHAASEFVVKVTPPDLAIDGDPERLHQVVANLVENAVRFSPPGGKVTLRCRRDGTARAAIEIMDEGPGIAAADAARIFERFYRADEARSSGDGGAGLGLSIARWIVELHGGRIRAERNEPRGARMVVVLPAPPAPSARTLGLSGILGRTKEAPMPDAMPPDPQDLLERLTPLQYDVTQKAGTEQAFTGEYWDCHDDGTYHCIVCDTPLFASDAKFESGSGWPSFYAALDKSKVRLVEDRSHGMVRTEVQCATCGAHLGHLFPDGPQPTGDRFCMNSASLRLEPDEPAGAS